MKFSSDPHRASLQKHALESSRDWISSARTIRGLYGTFVLFRNVERERIVRDCIGHARRCSRAAWQMNRSPN